MPEYQALWEQKLKEPGESKVTAVTLGCSFTRHFSLGPRLERELAELDWTLEEESGSHTLSQVRVAPPLPTECQQGPLD